MKLNHNPHLLPLYLSFCWLLLKGIRFRILKRKSPFVLSYPESLQKPRLSQMPCALKRGPNGL